MAQTPETRTLDIVRAPNLADQKGIMHGFFTRRGGVSGGIYAGLNCGQGSKDDPDHVRENKRRAMAAMGLGADDLALVHQVHSPDVWTADAPRDRAAMEKADALVSRRAGLALGILTADCAPVLFADGTSGVAAAAHAGWRGAMSGVLENTVARMEAQGAKRSNIHAALGPCIRQPSYEVGQDMKDAFAERHDDHEKYFAGGARPGHYQFDLAGFIMDRLAALNLATTHDVGLDTYADAERFYSYRRATHQGEPDYGRELAVVALATG
ncbi:MAG: polyphenol oxidase [Magnetovibrio sp.]|nr:polyphenol oxidase [Magnetovibrio sp.]